MEIVLDITEQQGQTDQVIGAPRAYQWLITRPRFYFRRLAARCLTAARQCFELQAKEEFRKLADEFSAKPDALERD